MKKDQKYADVLQGLQDMVERMDRGEISIDELSDTVKSAAKKIRFLRKRLKSTEAEINQILKDLEQEKDPDNHKVIDKD